MRTQIETEVIAALISEGRADLAPAVLGAPYQSPRFDYEGLDAGVTINPSSERLKICVYHPLANINKRGKKVEIIEYRFQCNRDVRKVASMVRKSLTPKLPLARVMHAVRSTLLAAEKQSIMRGDPYPAKAYEPFKRSIKGVDPLIPDPSSSTLYEEQRGKDVCVRFVKPEITITSIKSAREAMKDLEHYYLTLNWFWANKVAELAVDLAKLKGLDNVMSKLDENGIKYKIQRYAEPLYASTESSMKKRQAKAATNQEVNRFLKEAGILPPGASNLREIGPNPQWSALLGDKAIVAKKRAIASQLRRGNVKAANTVAKKRVKADPHSYKAISEFIKANEKKMTSKGFLSLMKIEGDVKDSKPFDVTFDALKQIAKIIEKMEID